MHETDCRPARDRIAIDPETLPGDVMAHVEGCEACRLEVAVLRDAIGLLRESAEVEPSAGLDRAVREALATTAGSAARSAPRSALRPFVAIGMAVAGLLALGSATAGALAQAGAAESGPLLAAVAVWAYLALSSTATLPLLLFRRDAVTPREVHR